MIRLPWTEITAPNVMIEITHSCNLRCVACYSGNRSGHKSINAIKDDLNAAMKLRPIDTVTITGGEPLLHPELDQIIRLLSGSGLKTFLLSNGLLANPHRLKELQKAGLHDILFHVDLGQNRTDFPRESTIEDVVAKQETLFRMAEKARLDPSASFTVYDESPEDIARLVDWFIRSQSGTMLFLSKATNPDKIMEMDQRLWKELSEYLKRKYHLDPFAYIQPSRMDDIPVWYSYFIPVKTSENTPIVYPYRGSVADSLLMDLGWKLKRRHTHRMPKSKGLIALRVLTNGLATRQLGTALRFLRKKDKQPLRHKMIVYDSGPYRAEDGEIIRCSFCPTAIVADGRLVKCCELNYKEREET